MAALGHYEFRDPTLEDYMNFEHELDVIQRKGNVKQDLKIIHESVTMPSGATMIAADALRTNVFDGTSTPIVVYAISSDNVEDKAGQDGALEVTVFGTDENDLYVEVAITLNGTTQVSSVTKFKRLIGCKLTECGVDGIATGTITITNTGQTATYLTITIGQGGSTQAGKTYIPDGYKGMILRLKGNIVQTTDANKVLTTDGANIWVRKFGVSTVTEDELHQYSVLTSKDLDLIPHWEIVDGGDDVYFDIYHQSVDTDITNVRVHYDIFYLVWKEAS